MMKYIFLGGAIALLLAAPGAKADPYMLPQETPRALRAGMEDLSRQLSAQEPTCGEIFYSMGGIVETYLPGFFDLPADVLASSLDAMLVGDYGGQTTAAAVLIVLHDTADARGCH